MAGGGDGEDLAEDAVIAVAATRRARVRSMVTSAIMRRLLRDWAVATWMTLVEVDADWADDATARKRSGEIWWRGPNDEEQRRRRGPNEEQQQRWRRRSAAADSLPHLPFPFFFSRNPPPPA
ncbi:uncharacterized protein DS421_15g515910 [Arachis hypogaea]|nr:uncharacterized protein DS421_15g515910 [Arachis hypogaea]